jgi:hypothetical protein
MRFELIIERSSHAAETPEKRYCLRLRNIDREETVTLMEGNSMSYLKGRGSDLFDAENPSVARRINWCDGDDPHYDSTEPFSL